MEHEYDMRRVWRQDGLDDVAYQIKDVYAYFGATMALAQSFERSALNIVSFAQSLERRAGDATEPWEEMWNTVYDHNSAMTMGPLLKKLQKYVLMPDELIGEIVRGLALRNRLAHGFMWDNRENMGSVTGRNEMLRELREIQNTMRDLHALIDPALKQLFLANGWTEEMWNSETDRRRRERQQRDAKRDML